MDKTEADLLGRIRNEHVSYMGPMFTAENNKEENTMKVSYKGVTGEMVRMERRDVFITCGTNASIHAFEWELDIFDSEKGCKVSFHDVSLKDVKFLGGEVTYG